ncbi:MULTISPECIES: hypothetical protein [Klebsiella pneumoniae complex]|uniref:hypothetical protein n=1 Tax=Klebsiella pneumoniae complex TaxID=3390273 RepID=UPI000DE7267A|nr:MULTISPECIES: hypothetical protein [Klebsiella]MBV0688828.1 hypothetical protein [Klebsiella quasipneumoniae]MCS4386347.1 hypothetical protein [Klebsiella quasipneumoniae subsp. similipneumoniae]MCS4413359.1 hypothetical protein [Klebsiella quasipneumoniae subsp. similipneumoniae]NSM80195.1 hypothetical protein [Klebsiella variicola]SSJ03148.1 Uncharacterised protein [Klebsiella pneumoniae]
MPDLSPLDSWLRVSTWDTHHSSDEERFYKSIYRLILLNDKLVEPQYIRDYIIKYHAKGNKHEHLDNIAGIYAEKYDVIFSFLYENKINLN